MSYDSGDIQASVVVGILLLLGYLLMGGKSDD
jgi:hypothetical protein